MDEEEQIKKLANNNQTKADKLTAAACRMVWCTSGNDLTASEKSRYEALMSEYPESATTSEWRELNNAYQQSSWMNSALEPGLDNAGSINNTPFAYSISDLFSDAWDQYLVNPISNRTGWSTDSVQTGLVGVKDAALIILTRKPSSPFVDDLGKTFKDLKFYCSIRYLKRRISQQQILAKVHGLSQKIYWTN